MVEFALGSVARDMTKTSFLMSALGRGAETIVENGPYVTYRIRPESRIGATLLFEGEKLQNFGWAIELPDELPGDWSAESEMRRKRLHDDWLRKEFGEPPYRFAWGEIVSDYDAKGVSSAIIVAYAA
jgi:hypothetical protein